MRPCPPPDLGARAPWWELNFDRCSATIRVMKYLALFVTVIAHASAAQAETIKRDIPYAGVEDAKRTLDVYAPTDAKNLPVVFWIHGGGWQTGDKTDVK